MITSTSSASLADRGSWADPVVASRRGRLTLQVEAVAFRLSAPPAQPRRLASALGGFVNDGAPVALGASAAAARAFAAGTGFLPGQIIDRVI